MTVIDGSLKQVFSYTDNDGDTVEVGHTTDDFGYPVIYVELAGRLVHLPYHEAADLGNALLEIGEE